MSTINIGLILLSSLFHSIWNVQTQTSKNSQYFSGLKGLLIIGMALLWFVFVDKRTFPRDVLEWAIYSGVLHGLYILSLSKAYSIQDISYVYPIARSAPVFVPAFAYFFLGEKLSYGELTAIILIFLAIYTLHFDGHLIRGFKNLLDAVLHKDLRWSFYTLGIVVVYSLVDKRGMQVMIAHFPENAYGNGINFFFLESVVGFTLYNAYLALTFPFRDITRSWKNEWKSANLAAITTLGSYSLICVVLQFESVSAVVSLRQISVLMVVYWGCWKLGEPFGGKRVLASCIIILGVILMAMDKSHGH